MTDNHQIYQFNFERLDVFRVVCEFYRWVHQDLFPRLPRGTAKEKDQLHRSSLSMLLNTAEGAEQRAKRVKRNYYRIALSSSGESTAALIALSLAGMSHLEIGDRLVRRAARMLNVMSR